MSYRLFWPCVGGLVLATGSVQADWIKYYVSTDQRSLPFNDPSSTPYPDQPNYNRLTVLYEHRSSSTPHWHPKGRFQYTGSASSPTLGQNTGVLQESQASSGNWTRLYLSNPSDYGGAFGTGYFISKPVSGDVDDNFTIRSIESLRGFGPSDLETIMLNSSPLPAPDPLAGQGRYAGGLHPDSHVHLELVSVSDPVLKVFLEAEGVVSPMSVGSDLHVGDGNNWEFRPILGLEIADLPTVETTYTATFRLIDEEEIHGNSGLFTLTVAVPEPATLGLFGLGSLFLRRRR